jgi:DNA helicase-2/ATP-dependent DNA helicase PcrA
MSELNPQQKLAVETTEGPVLVLAGAGSGKTRVLTERVVHLIRDMGVSPARILAFTFTNKAAGEMKTRVQRLLGSRDLPFWVGTFHATGVRILRREAHHIGFGKDFAIYDQDDSTSLIKEIIKRRGWRLDECPPTLFRDRISGWKSSLVTPEEAAENASEKLDEIQAMVYKSYVADLKRCNAFDFDDLITRVVELFTAHPKVKERYARQFLYVHVDEFQDTNKIQMLMIDLLSSMHRNLFVVGDDDQAIYGWRGATVENILQFDRVYRDVMTIRLEENYRSTNTILRAANALIAYNDGRKGKNLWSKGEKGEPIELILVNDEEEEGHMVREKIIELVRRGWHRNDVAVLYRTNAQSRALEKAMREGGLAYQIVGGIRFYERREIRDLLGYLKVINNPLDNVNFRRIVNVPRRGIGNATMEKIERVTGERSLMLSIRREEVLSLIPTAQRKRVEEFSRMMARLELEARRKTVNDLLRSVIEKTKYRRYLDSDPATAENRKENVDELLVETERFVESSEDKSLAAFLEEIALISDVDTMKEEESISLMTLHNSKGLEFRAVFITGLEEGLLPHYSSFDTKSELEEERRLFYVGMTRTKEKLYLVCSDNRMRYGSWEGNKPSRFLEEIKDHYLVQDEAGGAPPLDINVFHSLRGGKEQYQDRDIGAGNSRYRLGAYVKHPAFGKGRISKVEGSGSNLMVTVKFIGKGTKKFLAKYAPFQFV